MRQSADCRPRHLREIAASIPISSPLSPASLCGLSRLECPRRCGCPKSLQGAETRLGGGRVVAEEVRESQLVSF